MNSDDINPKFKTGSRLVESIYSDKEPAIVQMQFYAHGVDSESNTNWDYKGINEKRSQLIS